MSKIVSCIISILFFLAFIIIPLKPALALTDCNSYGINYYTDPGIIPEDQTDIKMIFPSFSSGTYRLKFPNGALAGEVNPSDSGDVRSFASGGLLTIPISNSDDKLSRGTHIASLEQWEEGTTPKKWVPIGNSGCDVRYKVGYEFRECQMQIRPPVPTSNEPFAIDVIKAQKGDYKIHFAAYSHNIPGAPRVAGALLRGNNNITIDKFGTGSAVIGPLDAQKDSTIGLEYPNFLLSCDTTLNIAPSTGASPRPIPPPGETFKGFSGAGTKGGGIPCDGNGIVTAIGCIHTQPTDLVKDLLKFIVAISGGIAFLLMILGVFGMITSAGNPDNLQAGKDRLTSAIIGLLFVVLSVLLLKIIGVDILGLGTFLGV